jgi:hypothetical protein
LEVFLQDQGEKLLKSGREKRLACDHSVTIRNNEWYDHARQIGGKAISFVMQHYNLEYPEAVQMLIGSDAPCVNPVTYPSKPFSLPKANDNMHRLFAYLTKNREIDNDVLAEFVCLHLVYEEAKYHNVVFVGVDSDGRPRHAHLRSTSNTGQSFRRNADGSDGQYSFHYTGTSGSLFVFEAPIDMLSYITMHRYNWEQHSYVACCGLNIAPVLSMLESRNIDTIYLCLDNDSAGEEASNRMREVLENKGFEVSRLKPKNKDWNDDLVQIH